MLRQIQQIELCDKMKFKSGRIRLLCTNIKAVAAIDEGVILH